jgi:hypothetical protein
MKRLLIICGSVVAAGGIAAAPAVAGLTGNPSFSHQIPVRAPSQAVVPTFVDDHGSDRPSPSSTRTPTHTRHAEPGDDHGGISRHAEPGDDRGGASSSTQAGDDHGGDRGGEGSGGNGGSGDSGSGGGGSGGSGGGSGGRH